MRVGGSGKRRSPGRSVSPPRLSRSTSQTGKKARRTVSSLIGRIDQLVVVDRLEVRVVVTSVVTLQAPPILSRQFPTPRAPIAGSR